MGQKPVVKFVLIFCAIVAVTGGSWFAVKHVFAASYNFSDVGAITSFQVKNSAGTVLNSTTGVGFASTMVFTYDISGAINSSTLSALQPGDQIIITIDYDPNSTYRMSTLNYNPNLNDTAGITQFNVSTSDQNIILTKTAAPIGNSFSFNLASSQASVSYIAANWQALYSSVWIDGFQGQTVTFPNSAKTSSLENNLCLNTGLSANGIGNVSIRPLTLTTQIYNNLLAGQNIQTLYANLASTDYIVVMTLNANNQIRNITGGNTPTMVYDMMPSGTQLSSGFAVGVPPYFSFNQVTIAPDLSTSAVYTALATSGKGAYGIVKNSNDSYTLAVNYGKIIGDTAVAYPNTNVAATMPNTTANNQILANLTQQAVNMNLAAMRFYTTFGISFYDPDVVNTATFSFTNNLLSTCGSTTVTYNSQAVSNTAEGSSQIVTHYLDTAGNPIASPTHQHGYAAADAPSGYTGSTSANVVPADVDSYSLITDSDQLNTIASDVGIVNNGTTSQVLATSATLDFPTISSGSIVAAYYFYEPTPIMLTESTPMTITFNSNGGSSVPTQTIEYNTPASRPIDPTRAGYTFDHWYICSDPTQAEYDFTTPIADDTQLCASWTAVSLAKIVPGIPNTGTAAMPIFTTTAILASTLPVVGIVLIIKKRVSRQN
ncbi:InlB B-repeat-containing protein [Candidatus Saccharibacteria bacterium]|nr:InlB B-repeat-containing protein [Candidatus Saccharibacteria bacterium]